MPPKRARGWDWGAEEKLTQVDFNSGCLLNKVLIIHNHLRNFHSAPYMSTRYYRKKSPGVPSRVVYIPRFGGLLPSRFCRCTGMVSKVAITSWGEVTKLRPSDRYLMLWLAPSSDRDKRKLIGIWRVSGLSTLSWEILVTFLPPLNKRKRGKRKSSFLILFLHISFLDIYITIVCLTLNLHTIYVTPQQNFRLRFPIS